MIFTEVDAVPGAWVIEPERVADERGWFARTYAAAEFAARGLSTEIVQVSSSFNAQAGTLRGMHLQRAPHGEAKLIRCTAGRVFDVMVDVRAGTPTFGRWAAFELDPGSGRAVYLPAGVAHGFVTLADGSELTYQIDAPYVAEAGAGFRWDDPDAGIAWPLQPTVISARDRELPPLAGLAGADAGVHQ
ncbi:MAG TPA: dTDP-4-dehydrorhamnose 3,5-epimerase [Acidimicrobiales bacterium]